MSSRSCVKIDESVISAGFLDSFDYVLTDCDGVLWIENDPIPGSVETIQALKNIGKHIIYVTNNNTKCRDEYLKKCYSLGLPATFDDIFCTSYCVAAYLKSKNFQKKVYVFGTSGITQELDKANVQYLPIGPDPVPEQWKEWIDDFKGDPEVGAVIVGFDQHVSYPKLTKAASYVKNKDNLFIATNRDEQFPKGDGRTMPADGPFVAALENISGRKCVTLGKPEKYILDCIKETHPNIDFSRCIMIGDKLNTDILLGTRHGIKTVLVLTGISTLEDVAEHQKSLDKESQLFVPDYYLSRLGDLLPFIQS